MIQPGWAALDLVAKIARMNYTEFCEEIGIADASTLRKARKTGKLNVEIQKARKLDAIMKQAGFSGGIQDLPDDLTVQPGPKKPWREVLKSLRS